MVAGVSLCAWHRSTGCDAHRCGYNRYMDDLLSHIEARAKVHRGMWVHAVLAVINKEDHVYLPDAFSAAEV